MQRYEWNKFTLNTKIAKSICALVFEVERM